jgi:tRNA U34 5-carboxymethylaminomethyl modifying GTPase MnmE/TrmE
MAQIHDPLQQAEGLLTRLKPLAERYLPDAQAVLDDLQARLKQNSLQVMLLGAYNAGKSTVVNLLLGEVQARIGDIPTTDVVDAYPWGGHVLLDTPGVNAPIEHEQVSNQALERTDLVLFVIRQEDQDSENIIGRLLDLVAQGRPVFVLLNHDDPGHGSAGHPARARYGAGASGAGADAQCSQCAEGSPGAQEAVA